MKEPTVDQIRAEIERLGYDIDAGLFLWYYKATGWCKTNGFPLKSWKGALTTWRRQQLAREKARRMLASGPKPWDPAKPHPEPMTPDQIEAVNEARAKRGLPPLDQ